MTSTQKTLLVIGLLLVAVTSAFAPYRWEGYNNLRMVITGVREDLNGTAYGPVWSPPRDPQGDESRARVTDVQLDTGKLGIWWGGIAMLTVAGILLAGSRKQNA